MRRATFAAECVNPDLGSTSNHQGHHRDIHTGKLGHLLFQIEKGPYEIDSVSGSYRTSLGPFAAQY